MRSRMAVDTGLVVVGSADDQLRMTKTKKRLEGITQNMVDRCILVRIKCQFIMKCCLEMSRYTAIQIPVSV